MESLTIIICVCVILGTAVFIYVINRIIGAVTSHEFKKMRCGVIIVVEDESGVYLTAQLGKDPSLLCDGEEVIFRIVKPPNKENNNVQS